MKKKTLRKGQYTSFDMKVYLGEGLDLTDAENAKNLEVKLRKYAKDVISRMTLITHMDNGADWWALSQADKEEVIYWKMKAQLRAGDIEYITREKDEENAPKKR